MCIYHEAIHYISKHTTLIKDHLILSYAELTWSSLVHVMILVGSLVAVQPQLVLPGILRTSEAHKSTRLQDPPAIGYD
jgi:hypothetical protein